MKHVIVGTAGHIDHGKTLLVKALTGIDADRLKEEKQRGITIDIGFADLNLDGVRIGFIDVPGHERFVKNMLAGAHGVDLVMLVVSADESVMPQTREHFDICRLLGVKSGLVALTKSDMVDPELLELAKAEVEDFVQGSFLEGAPIIAVSSRTGEGIEELKSKLAELAAAAQPKTIDAVPRLPVDRSFSVKGFGTVITGTLIAGELHIGDELEVLPSGVRSRVRNLQVHGHDTDIALAGQRTAVNLQGINVEHVERGSVLALAGRLAATQMIDAELYLLPSAARPLLNRARVRFHHQTAEVMARVMVLSTGSPARDGQDEAPSSLLIQQGDQGFVQLRLEAPVTALPGDRFIIRSYSPQITIGGGVILDASPAKHRLKDRAGVLAGRLADADISGKGAIFIETAAEHGISGAELAARTGATDEQINELKSHLLAEKKIVEASSNPLLLVSKKPWQSLASELELILAEYHKKQPLSLGLSREEVRDRVFGHLRPEIFRSVVQGLIESGRIIAERDTLRLASHRPELSDEDSRAMGKLESAIRGWGLQAGSMEDAAERAGIKLELARKLYDLLSAEDKVQRVGDMIFYRENLDHLKERVKLQKSINPRIDVASFKDITGGLTRKHAIPLLEFLDRERITRRVGNEREIL